MKLLHIGAAWLDAVTLAKNLSLHLERASQSLIVETGQEESAPAPQEQKAVATPGVRYRVVYKKARGQCCPVLKP